MSVAHVPYILRAKANKSAIWPTYQIYKNILAIPPEEKVLWMEFVLVLELLSSKPKLQALFSTLCFNRDQSPILSKTCFGSFLYWFL